MVNRDELYVFLKEQCEFNGEELYEYLNNKGFKFFLNSQGSCRLGLLSLRLIVKQSIFGLGGFTIWSLVIF